MFYTVLSEDGFCYIPNVNVVDEANINEYDAKLIKNQTITREFVSKLLSKGAVKFKFDTFEDAEDLARAIYKKLPRYRRELGYNTEEDGAGTWESEVSDKYL